MGLRDLIMGRPGGLRSKLKQILSAEAEPSTAAPPVPRAEAPKSTTTAGADIARVKAPEGFEAVVALTDIPDGGMAEAIVSGREVALARIGDQVYALDNACPHAGGPIGEGDLEGTTVTCPYHGWAFDVTTGACHVDHGRALATYATAVADGAVCVRVT